MKTLIVGASGLIGNALYLYAVNELKTPDDVLGTYQSFALNGLVRFDYSDRSETKKLLETFKPDVILCPAGKTNVDWIEKNPKEAWEINISKLAALFSNAAEKDIPVAIYGTDYLFDGKNGPYSEDDLPNPINVYGHHKLASELMLKSYLPEKHFIFRTTLVFGYENQGKNFLYSIVNSLKAGKEIEIPEDLLATPTYIRDIAKFSFELARKKLYGTYNLSCGENISRYDFAKKIANVFGLNEKLIKPVKYASLPKPAKRPLLAGLKNEKVNKAVGLGWTPLETAIKEVKNQIESARPVVIAEKTGDSKICIFIPCYNATVTLPKVFERIPASVKEKVEEIFVVDNNSEDFTYLMAIGYREKSAPDANIKNLKIFKNAKNFGYGGSQKIAYAYAIKQGYDMVVMLHGDAQYAPEKLPVMIEEMEKDKSIDLLFGSRMKGDPLKGGMPIHRFLGNKALTFIQNFLLGTNISEFHSGYRIFRTSALKKVPFDMCSNDYHFDTEIIILFVKNQLKIAEVPIDTHYGHEKNYVKIWEYGLNVLVATLAYVLYKQGVRKLIGTGLEKYNFYKDGLTANIEKVFNDFKTEVY